MSTLPEYDDNPFIAALPPVVDMHGLKDRLAKPPSFDPVEKNDEPDVAAARSPAPASLFPSFQAAPDVR